MSAMKGLGRGFDSLIPTDLLDDDFDPTAQQDEKVSQLRDIPLSQITADPDQPRRRFDQDGLEELAESIKTHGVIQPVIVIAKDNAYQLVAGERRWRASKLAGLKTIPALVRTLDSQNKLEVSLIENLQRTDLSAVETATAYLKLRDQFNLTLEEIGKRVNKSGVAISNTMRLLKLPKIALEAIDEGNLTEGQARPLIGEEEAFIEEILPKIIEEGWSARKIEQYMVQVKAARAKQSEERPAQQVIEHSSLNRWRERLGTDNVNIRTNSRGAGQITIKFKNQAELEKIEKLLG